MLKNAQSALRKYKFCILKLQCYSKETIQNYALRKRKPCPQNENSTLRKFTFSISSYHGKLAVP